MEKSPIDIPKYLDTTFSNIPTPVSIVRLTGGEINYVYRVSFDQPIAEFGGANSVVIKISLEVMASHPEVKFGLERQIIEARAMAFLAPTSTWFSLPLSFPNPYPCVITPTLYHYSPQHNIIIMQDMGSHPDLYQFLSDCMTTPQEACALGELLGNYLCCFHTFTKDHVSELKPYFTNNAAQTLLQDAFYSAATPLISHMNLPASQVTWLTNKIQLFGIQDTLDPKTSTEAIKMGDLWPRAFLIPPNRQELIIIDWEFCSIGNPAVEVGYFVSFLYLLANFPPPKNRSTKGMEAASVFMKEFLQTYASKFVPKDTKAFWKDIQVIIGIELLSEAGKGRWSLTEECTCEKECLLVEKEEDKERICVRNIVKIGIELLEGEEEVLEKILCMKLNELTAK